MEVAWDGNVLPSPRIEYAGVMGPMGYDVSTVVWQSYNLPPGQMPAGNHQVKVILRERNPSIETDIELTDVEVVVRYED